MQTTEIQTSKIKLLLIFLGCIGFLALSYYLFNYPENFTSYRYRNPKVVKVVGVIGMLFFLIVLLYVPKKLFDKKPGLIIDEKGIIDNSSAVNVGFIAWSEVKYLKTISVNSTQFLLIYVNNSERYLEGFNKIKRMMLKTNNRIYGTPISINANGLKINFKNLEKLITEKFEQYKDSNLK